jgi:hypothetical protein
MIVLRPEEYLNVFFACSDSSRQAGQAALKRMYARNQDRDTATNWATRQAQYDAVCNWGVPDHAALQRVSATKHPVFVANGDSDRCKSGCAHTRCLGRFRSLEQRPRQRVAVRQG